MALLSHWSTAEPDTPTAAPRCRWDVPVSVIAVRMARTHASEGSTSLDMQGTVTPPPTCGYKTS